MRVKINDDYQIESDGRNFVLKSRILRTARDGSGQNEYWSDTYYGKLEHLLERVLDKTLNVSEAANIDQIRNIILETKRDILAAIGSSELAKFMEKREEAKPKPETKVYFEVPVKKREIVPPSQMPKKRGRPPKKR